MQKFSSNELRNLFLKYFEEKDHYVVPSSSLIPALDPTLLFTNAGMNQFKGVFTGQEKRNYKRAVTSQKCVRAGGKHNDLENVGYTHRHHTFFEMLGNFSFGDYFKKQAIQYAWEFVTEQLKLPTDRLVVSVFQEDEDAFQVWTQEIGVETKRIFRCGEKENFWSMGETGPCGPCSEIFYDQKGGPISGKEFDEERFLEIWNLVFMEFEQRADGTRIKLPKPSIDTGMGLERTCSVIQGVPSNYDTDLFVPLLREISVLCAQDYWETNSKEAKISMRVIADHIRAMTFLISDGIFPSKEGRGYVLRRIMRRAMRHAKKLEMKEKSLSKLSSVVVKTMGDHYTELKKNTQMVSTAIYQEEERFSETIDRGLALLNEEIQFLKKEKEKTLNGEAAFRLYDTYGFPVDLTADILAEQGLELDQNGFEEAFAKHREKARGSWKGSGTKALDSLINKWTSLKFETKFVGYEKFSQEGAIQALVKNGKEVKTAKKGDEVELISDQTPFYGESGGQVGDIGSISGQSFSLEVLDTQKLTPGIILHKCRVENGKVQVGEKAVFSVDENARSQTAKNHTATHILHATLKEALGEHVMQKGSLVAPERLRFDFTHPSALASEEISRIERMVNERIWLDTQVQKEVLPLEKALSLGAVALFDEKYGENVRVLSIGNYSKELCGGTHLTRTGEIGLFKIIKESSVAAGIRRLEAYTGYRALRYVEELDQKMHELSTLLGSPVEEVEARIKKLIDQQKQWKKKGGKAISTEIQDVQVSEVNGIKFLKAEVSDVDHQELRNLADRQLEKIQSGVVAIGTKQNGKAFLVVKVSKDLSKRFPAGKLIQPAAKLLGGSGGGRPEMAQAGGDKVLSLSKAIEAVGTPLKEG